MKLPSVQTINLAFPNQGAIIRAALDQYAATQPRIWVLHQINKIIGGYGVECIRRVDDACGPAHLAYINLGDTYSTTVCYDFLRHRFFIGCWGDWVERNDPRGTKY